MVAANSVTIRHEASQLTHADACEIAARASESRLSGMVYVSLNRTSCTTTAALARLILLRRRLLAGGRDLRIVGLVGRARSLYEVSRLTNLLPRLHTPAPLA